MADFRAPMILPSLLQCDFANLQQEIERLTEAGVEMLHLDVMDGVFVPNLSYGMPVVAAIRRVTELPLDVHLMITKPERYIEAFREAGADYLTVHVEAVEEPRRVLKQIRETGAKAGLAINPSTPFEGFHEYLSGCDWALVMSVEAGFGGQVFNPIALERLAQLRELAGDRIVLEVDGGINADTIRSCAEAGAQWFVIGSAIFREESYGRAVNSLQQLATLD